MNANEPRIIQHFRRLAALFVIALTSMLASTPVASAAPAPASVTVGGRAFFDADRNGSFGPADSGQGIVLMTLTGPGNTAVVDVDGQPVDPVVTGNEGLYRFEGLPLLGAGEQYVVTANETYVDGDSQSSGDLTAAGDENLAMNFRLVPAGPFVSVVSYTTDEGPEIGTHSTGPAAQLLAPDTAVGLTISVVNGGAEPLVDLVVLNVSQGEGLMGALDCDFSLLGGPATGTTWAGPMTVGSKFECRAEFSGMAAGGNHETITTVNAINQTTGTPLNPDPPGTPGNPNADYWYSEVADIPTVTTTVPPTDVTLPETGSTGTVAAIAALLTLAGCALVCGAARSRRPLRA